MKIIRKFDIKAFKNLEKMKKFSKWRPFSFEFSTNSQPDYHYYRKWLSLCENNQRKPDDLRIMSYNILAETYAYDHFFPKCSKEDKMFEFRSKVLRK